MKKSILTLFCCAFGVSLIHGLELWIIMNMEDKGISIVVALFSFVLQLFLCFGINKILAEKPKSNREKVVLGVMVVVFSIIIDLLSILCFSEENYSWELFCFSHLCVWILFLAMDTAAKECVSQRRKQIVRWKSFIYGVLAAGMVNQIFWGSLIQAEEMLHFGSAMVFLVQIALYYIIDIRLYKNKDRVFYSIGLFAFVPIVSYINVIIISSFAGIGLYMEAFGYMIYFVAHMLLWTVILLVHILATLFMKKIS